MNNCGSELNEKSRDVNPVYLPTGYPRICLMRTDIMEPERLVRNIAEESAMAHPELFRGATPLVVYRMHYTPPYENFRELRQLILQIRLAAGLSSEYRGLICIDPSDYKGHENEEYFKILLKYLYDNAANSTVIMTCCQYSERDMLRLRDACTSICTVDEVEEMLFVPDRLARKIMSVYRQQGKYISRFGAAKIADAMQDPGLKAHYSLQMLERLPVELSCDNIKEMEGCLANPDFSLCRMAGHQLLNPLSDGR